VLNPITCALFFLPFSLGSSRSNGRKLASYEFGNLS
jgi:hypothetical protein